MFGKLVCLFALLAFVAAKPSILSGYGYTGYPGYSGYFGYTGYPGYSRYSGYDGYVNPVVYTTAYGYPYNTGYAYAW